MIIDILKWDITYTELLFWISDTGAVLKAINGYGVGASTQYKFQNEADFVAFKLKFKKTQSGSVDYEPIDFL